VEGFVELGLHDATKVKRNSVTDVIILRVIIGFIARIFLKEKKSWCRCVRENLVLHSNLAIAKIGGSENSFPERFAAAAEILFEIKRNSVSRKPPPR
jgi:hypothetical protein